MNDQHSVPRASTGIEGLDAILGGGLPRERLYMVEGVSGTGKTTLGLQFCLGGVRAGERAVYISLSESEDELREVIASHGWSSEGLVVLSFADCAEDVAPGQEYTLFHPSEVELGQTTHWVLEAVEKHRPQRLVLDTLSGLRLMADDPLRYRRQIQSLRSYLTTRGCTVLIIDETEEDKSLLFQPRSLAHGVICLQSVVPEYGPERRRLLVRKVRGVPYRSGYHDCRLTTGGLEIYPRLVASAHPPAPLGTDLVSSGIDEIDRLLGDGLQQGGSTLIMGAAGTGKSTISLQYCIAAAERGERSVCFMFDERLDTAIVRAEGLGMDIRRHLDSGLLQVRQMNPAEVSPGEFAHDLRELTTETDLRLVVIDSLSGYLYAMPEERHLHLHLHELLSFLGSQGVTVLLTLVQHGLVGEHVQTPAELSFLADTVILLRYFEAQGEVRKAVSVLKKRAGLHETSIRELVMDRQGIHVGEPLRDFQGVLTGVPQFVGRPESIGPR